MYIVIWKDSVIACHQKPKLFIWKDSIGGNILCFAYSQFWFKSLPVNMVTPEHRARNSALALVGVIPKQNKTNEKKKSKIVSQEDD